MHVVITTIQQPTPSVRELARRLGECSAHLVIAGDSKGPHSFPLSEVERFSASNQLSFLSLEDQLASPFELSRRLPVKHYARKNIGYLHAIAQGADCIYETDDDNAPLTTWRQRAEYVSATVPLKSANTVTPQWVNVYRHFSADNVWPRGLPLDQIRTPHSEAPDFTPPGGADGQVWAPIQQGLANGSPDVDAIWRLVLEKDFEFEDAPSALLPPGQWCPFNTQSTWWWSAVYPLLYIPSYCSFRMCDIWKSFIAQRCLWELGTGVVFHAAEVLQERNVHNLMRDFNDEIPGYRRNTEMVTILQNLSLRPGPEHCFDNLRKCYEALVAAEFFPAAELDLVEAWISDLQGSTTR